MFQPKNEPIKAWVTVHCPQYPTPQRVPYEYMIRDDGSRLFGPIYICDNGNGSITCGRCLGDIADIFVGTPIDQQLPAEVHLAHK